MKTSAYLKYFFFIFRYWNIGLAWFTIKHEIRGEKKYKVNTIGIDRLKKLSVIGDNKAHASIYQAANYYLLEEAFNFLKEEKATVTVVDFGAGKGRVMAVAAYYGYPNIKGIEFAPAIAAMAQINVANIQSTFPDTSFTIFKENAVKYSVEKEDNIFFFFNPFDEVVMLEVVKNILASLRTHPRKVFVVYINPLHKDIFQSAGFFEEYYLSIMEYLELSILTYQH